MNSLSVSWYVLIKLVEWVIWWGIGFYFLTRAFRPESRNPKIKCAVAIGFFIFGGADFIEYFTAGRLPWWLWVWKIVGGLILFGLLVIDDYFKRGSVALSPWRFVAATVILAMALSCWGYSYSN
jgi:hypothetical protein